MKDLEKISKLRKLQKEVKTQIDVILNEKGMKTVIEKIEEAAERKGRLEGKLEGKLEGRLEGELKGRLEGRLEGELKGKLEDAKGMLLEGLQVDAVARITKLSIAQIEIIAKEIASKK